MRNLRKIMKEQHLTEQSVALSSNLTRNTVRKALKQDSSINLENMESVVRVVGQEFITLFVDKNLKINTNYSIPIISFHVANGEDWRIHFFNFVDYFRKTKDERLIISPPVPNLSEKHTALIKSIVFALCVELEISVPTWAKEMHWLPEPWFISGFESLKATAISETPIYFKRNNIWVLDNFLNRA